MPQKTIFEMAASRGPFIDQSQCLNVHMIDPLEKLTSMHFYAWEIVSIKCHILIIFKLYEFNVKCIFFYLQGLKSSMYHLITYDSNIK